MKSAFIYLIGIYSLTFFSTNIYTQNHPENPELDPIHILTHVKQNGTFYSTYGDGENTSFGCLDPSQPFSIELIFEESSYQEGTIFYIDNENGENLFETRLSNKGVSLLEGDEGQTYKTTLTIDNLVGVNCDNYGSTVTLTLSTSQSPHPNFHDHIFEITINLCCEEGLVETDNNSFFVRLGEQNLNLISDFKDEMDSKNEQIYNLTIFNINGNKIIQKQTYDISQVPISQIEKAGIYFLVINGKNKQRKVVYRIYVIE